MKDYFFCYNKHVCDFLTLKGIRYITIALNMKTEKIFSLYEITQELQKALDEFKNYSK